MLICFRPIAVSVSSDSCRMIFPQVSDETETVVGRLLFSKTTNSLPKHKNYLLRKSHFIHLET